MNSHRQTNHSKEPYEKPRLRAINLVGREVLGIGCKTYDPNYFPPNFGVELGCGLGVPCSAFGT